jgi:hypothetical protein
MMYVRISIWNSNAESFFYEVVQTLHGLTFDKKIRLSLGTELVLVCQLHRKPFLGEHTPGFFPSIRQTKSFVDKNSSRDIYG